jgi:hypothetical protein
VKFVSTKNARSVIISWFNWLNIAMINLLVIASLVVRVGDAFDAKGWLFLIGCAILSTLVYIVHLLERLVRDKEKEALQAPNIGANTYKE